MASVLGQWPVLPLETAASLRAGGPGHLADSLAQTWASERGCGYVAQPTPASRPPSWRGVSGLALPWQPPASSDENLDRGAGSINLDACSKLMPRGLSYVPGLGEAGGGQLR